MCGSQCIFLLAGAGAAALACAGAPLFGLRLGQLLLPNVAYISGASSLSSERGTGGEVDVAGLIAALAEAEGPVPIVFRSSATCVAPATAATAAAASKPGSGSGVAAPAAPTSRRHYVAVGIPAGTSLVGMLLLSATGPRCPPAWQPESLHTLAALLAPLLRKPQVPLARRSLAELLVGLHHRTSWCMRVAGAAADLLAASVRVALTPRVALLRSDGSAAAVFSVGAAIDCGGGGGTSVCRRRSTEVMVVDGSGCGAISRAAEFFMTGQPGMERESMGPPAVASVGCGNANANAHARKSLGERLLSLYPGGGAAAAAGCGMSHGTAGTAGAGAGLAIGADPAGCRGQSLPLQHTLLSEALARGGGAGLCIADCNAYVQDSKAYPRDLALFRGAAPAQSLALATGCHEGRPLLALYATYSSVLPQALLQTAVQELGQLLRALTPAVAALLLAPEGPCADEWRYLHDDLLSAAALAGERGGHGGSSRPGRSSGAGKATAAAIAAVTAAAVTPTATATAAGGGLTRSEVKVSAPGNAEGPGTPQRLSPAAPTLAAALSTASGGVVVAAATATVMSPRDGTAASRIGAFFRRSKAGQSDNKQEAAAAGVAAQQQQQQRQPSGGGGGTAAAVASARSSAAGEVPARVVTPAELVTVMNAAAAALSGADADADCKRLAAFVDGGPVSGADGGGAAAAAVVSGGGGGTPGRGGGAVVRGTMPYTGRTSFSLEAAGSPRGGVRLAPLISTLHERLKTAQAEQLTTSSRAASRLQDLESLRIQERVGKGGYGSVYRGTYHGGEVAIKVVEDPATSLHLSSSLAGGAGSTALRAKHLHDAIELVASVSMSHPNIVQLITYFVDVRTAPVSSGITPGLRRGGGGGARDGGGGGGHDDADTFLWPAGGGACERDCGDGGCDCGSADDGECCEEAEDGEPAYPGPSSPLPPLQLVHCGSEGPDSSHSSFTSREGNEAIVLVMLVAELEALLLESNAAASRAAAGARRKPPAKCATETAIRSLRERPPAANPASASPAAAAPAVYPGGGGVAVGGGGGGPMTVGQAVGVAAASQGAAAAANRSADGRQPARELSYYLYQPPQALYQPSGVGARAAQPWLTTTAAAAAPYGLAVPPTAAANGGRAVAAAAAGAPTTGVAAHAAGQRQGGGMRMSSLLAGNRRPTQGPGQAQGAATPAAVALAAPPAGVLLPAPSSSAAAGVALPAAGMGELFIYSRAATAPNAVTAATPAATATAAAAEPIASAAGAR
ncbi:hypothetical protein GPECTOR_95g683 [Gonium pectorale]|uniref:Protein kinase domain-containing protein n=1 Tax=Gonium pectorale TaxID=33097 RepID=A0A150G0C4_GONPE|nr:hypothetical protein GPECTOR_95g683 [Gonium pectorale]|eukprot:KXZ43294.1 hypothetical protein GPECTOR_95g683 [Gonium pectorale]